MAKLEFSVDVNRPVDEVFAYVTDPANLPEWQSSAIEGRRESAEPMATGTRFIEVRKLLGRRFESTVEVTDYQPNRRFAIRMVAGPVPFRVEHTFEPLNGGTRVRVVGEGEPGGFFKVAEPLVVRAVERQMKGDFETLKDLLESRG